MMNRENEEQKPVPQTLCGALQKEANCKCLVLSVLIYGCLAAVTWCRCANVTKIVINFSTFPIKSTKHVSPCDDGYIYIPVAFMGMLYLVYLVECYHSPIRIDLLHAEGQSGVLAKLTQLRLAQPTIWWKAISYHYVRRKRQIMRYRNGDNFTTTQVYYERVNSHAATSFYFYDYCGSKDISKELVLDPKIPITKITLSKGFAFSNVRSATEFEEARSRFFAEQEFRDDYMEMREGLDLGCNFSPMTLVSVLGNPWFTRSYVYWCLSALLLSWPLRIIIECNTQYVDYQVTKLFGVNYDTPTNIQIHTSASQLSAPGSYMLAPSYSEALLMEPAVLPGCRNGASATSAATAAAEADHATDLVPSYSEALLYERATEEHLRPLVRPTGSLDEQPPQYQRSGNVIVCECPCHGLVEHARTEADEFASLESLQQVGVEAGGSGSATRRDSEPAAGLAGVAISAEGSQRQASTDQQESPVTSNYGCNASGGLRSDARICDSCLSDTVSERRASFARGSAPSVDSSVLEHYVTQQQQQQQQQRVAERRRCIAREYSEPDLRRSAELLLGDGAVGFLRANGRSLENILENEENATENPLNLRVSTSVRTDTEVPSESTQQEQARSTGAIPKRAPSSDANKPSGSSVSSRVTVNPIAEAVKRLPSSRSTYFCLKSILKQNRRRFTLVTPEELQSLTHSGEHEGDASATATAAEGIGLAHGDGGGEQEVDAEDTCSCDGCRVELERPDSLRFDRQQRPLSCQSLSYRRENSRTLIFASPIQVVCPLDPFGGRQVVPSENPPDYEEALNLPVLSRLRRSLTDRDSGSASASATAATAAASASSSTSVSASKAGLAWRHRRTLSTDPQYLASFSSDNTRTGLITSTQSGRSETTISLPSYDGLTVPPDSHNAVAAGSYATNDERSPFLRLDELAAAAAASSGSGSSMEQRGTVVTAAQNGTNGGKTTSRLTRSLTERRSAQDSRRHDPMVRKSFTERIDTGCRIPGVKRTSINIETSL